MKHDPIQVAVSIENISGGDINLRTIPVFCLKDDLNGDDNKYWCPVDITTNNHLPANARSNIRLKQGESINANIDISKLDWGWGKSSWWPMENIYSKVPAGKYNLRLDIQICNEDDSSMTKGVYSWVYSNQVEVVIKK